MEVPFQIDEDDRGHGVVTVKTGSGGAYSTSEPHAQGHFRTECSQLQPGVPSNGWFFQSAVQAEGRIDAAIP